MKFAFIFSASAILIRLALYFTNYNSETMTKQVMFMHMLFVVLAVLLSILFPNRDDSKLSTSPLFTNIKNGLRGGVLYAVITAVFVFLFYKYIDPEFFYARRDAIMEVQSQAMDDPEMIAARVDKIKTSFTLFNYTTVTLVGFTSMALFTSIILGGIMHVMKKKML
jgi:hypothetical protein